MKKIITYSAQYIIIPEQPAQLRNQNQNQNHPRSFANKNPQSFANKKKFSKDRQEFINNIAASGFKQFIYNEWIYQPL